LIVGNSFLPVVETLEVLRGFLRAIFNSVLPDS
jgi:hypothetical protein